MERKRKIHQRALQHLPLQEKSVAVRNISKLSMYFEHVFKKKKQPARAAKAMGEPFSIGSNSPPHNEESKINLLERNPYLS